jgi:hypothetical protein
MIENLREGKSWALDDRYWAKVSGCTLARRLERVYALEPGEAENKKD